MSVWSMAALALAGLACSHHSPIAQEEGVPTRLQLSLTADDDDIHHDIGPDLTTSTAAGVGDIPTAPHYYATGMAPRTDDGCQFKCHNPDRNWLSLSLIQDQNNYMIPYGRFDEYVSIYSVADHSHDQSDALPSQDQISAQTFSPGMNSSKHEHVDTTATTLHQDHQCMVKHSIHPLWLCICGRSLVLPKPCTLDAHLSTDVHRCNMGTYDATEHKAVDWFFKSGSCFCDTITQPNRKHPQSNERRAHISSARHLFSLYFKLNMYQDTPNLQQCPLGCKTYFDIRHRCRFKYDRESQNEYLALLNRVAAKLMKWPGAEDIGQRAFVSVMTPPRYNARGKFIQEHDDVETVLQSIKDSIAADPDSCRYTVEAHKNEKRCRENNAGSIELPVVSNTSASQHPL